MPWSDGITEYDNQHDETYIRLLDADKEGVSKDEMARLILCIDPAKEPDRDLRAVESQLARARWMTKVGYRHLAAGRYPGARATPPPRIGPLAPMITGPNTDRPQPAVRPQ